MSQESLPLTLPETLSSPFNDEILKNVFNPSKRSELCIDEEDILSIQRSERGFSIDEGPELSLEENKAGEGGDLMKLKKTTVLTGNHLGGSVSASSSLAGNGGKAVRTRA